MSEISRARYFLIGLTLTCGAAALILAPVAGLKVDPIGFVQLAGFSVALIVIFSPLCHWRKIPSLQAAVECVALGLALTGPLVALTYIAAGTNQPLQDQSLMAMDLTLGLDWNGLIAFVDRHSWLARLLAFAYQTFGFQLLLVPALLSVLDQRARAYQMIAAYGLIAVFASIISIWYPAVGTYSALSLDIHQFKSINGTLGVGSVPQFLAIRIDPNFVLNLEQASGIITFPSVHAAVAVLCAWACWPIRWVRWPMLVLNTLMLCSAVTEGAHYVVDLISGIGLAGFVIALVLYVTRSYPAPEVRIPRWPSRMSA